MGWFLARTRFGRIVRATPRTARWRAPRRGHAPRLRRVFTLGVALGTVGGALVIPATAADNEMGIEADRGASRSVVIGGLAACAGAVAGALIVGC
jgi:branched-chain amino acid transport system permease protein